MKKIAGLVLLLAILILGSYYVTGIFTETRVKESIELVNRTNGIHVKVKNYERGWFDSSANLVWQFQFPNKNTGSIETTEFKMPLKIYHGPVMFSSNGVKWGMGYAHTVVQMPDKNLKQMKNMFTPESTEPALNLSLLVNFLGKTTFNASVPDFTLIAKKGGGKLIWSGMDTSIHISRDMKSFTGDFNLDGFNFSRQKMSAKLDAVQLDYNLYENSDGLLLGDANFDIPSLMVLNGDATIFEIRKLDLKSGTTQDDEVVNSNLSLTLEKVVVNNDTYGPGELRFVLRNLDAKALAKINELAQQAQVASELQKKQLMLAIMPELPKLLGHGAELEINPFSLKLPNGRIKGNLLISLPQGSFKNPFEIFAKIKGNGRLAVPAALVKQAIVQSIAEKMLANQLQHAIAEQNNENGLQPEDVHKQAEEMVNKKLSDLLDKGVITKQGNDYVIAISLENGKLLVNGSPFKPAMVQF